MPHDPGPLAAWFAEAVRTELAALEKAASAQIYEVLSGTFQGAVGAQAIFEFIVTDATRIPEDASGRLKIGDQEYAASVIGQEADRIRVLIDMRTPPTAIPRALLRIDDTGLLRKLAEVLETIAANPAGTSSLAATIFHPSTALVGTIQLPDDPRLATLSQEGRSAIAQARGSSVTYVWGPPGTGKTTFIAHLIASLVKTGERVLVMSHTNAAVDQALYAAVAAGENAGPCLA